MARGTFVAVAVLALVLGVAVAAPMQEMLMPFKASASFKAGTSELKMAGEAPLDQVIPLIFAVRQNTENLEAELMAVSDPASPRYGQFYTLEQLGKVFGAPESTAAVEQFLAQYELVSIQTTPNGEFIKVFVTVATANEMLSTTYYNFVSRADAARNIRIARTPAYYLPVSVAQHVEYVAYTTALPSVRRMPTFRTLEAVPGADGTATPSVISSYYGIKNNTVATRKASNAVFETIGQSFEPSDLTAFDSEFNVPAQKISKVVGTNSPSSCINPNNCVEAELDVQVITSIAQDTYTTFWSVPGSESFVEWAMAVAADSNPPLVNSISYGSEESENPASQMKSFDTEAAKLGLRGVSIVVASGDDGVAGEGARGNPSACGFNPSYPASPTHVTAVGATQGPESGMPEIACSSKTNGGITTGGGFSDTFTQPSYQSAAVAHYMSVATNLPPASMYNGKGRGYPDVAAMGHNYPIVVSGSTYEGSGTSASTPVFAGMVTLVNAARMEAGKKSLGFLNPALYQLDADCFHDITSGENNCAAGQAGSQTCCKYGFTAAKGWDPLTGLGSPKFETFKAALMALP